MKDIPTKLEKYLSQFDDDKQKEKLEFFISLRQKADDAGIQNARHWSMRQILSERSTGEIERRFAKLVKDKADLEGPGNKRKVKKQEMKQKKKQVSR